MTSVATTLPKPASGPFAALQTPTVAFALLGLLGGALLLAYGVDLRHARYFAERGTQARERVVGPSGERARKWLATNRPNLERAAASTDKLAALRAATALDAVFAVQGPLEHLVALLTTAMDGASTHERTHAFVEALITRGNAHRLSGDPEAAISGRSSAKTLVSMEIHEARFGSGVDSQEFIFTPGREPVADETDAYLAGQGGQP